MYRSDSLDDYEMIPFEVPNCIYMPREVDAIIEDSYLEDMNMARCEDEVENRQKNKPDDKYYDFDDKYDYDSKVRPRDVDRICRMIERNYPGIFRTMIRYGVPYPVAMRLCRRIVRITLSYC